MTKDGGPAFSGLELQDAMFIVQDLDGTTHDESAGYKSMQYVTGNLTVRDYFAAAALQGLIAADREEMCCKSLDDDGIERERVAYAEQFAKSAYRYADAMLRERERKPS